MVSFPISERDFSHLITVANWNELVQGVNLLAGGGRLSTDTVKYVIKTNTQTSSVAGAGSVEISGLTISHAVSKVGNSVLILGLVHTYGGFEIGFIAPAINGTVLANMTGDAAGGRARVHAAAQIRQVDRIFPLPILARYEPPSTASVTYSVRALNGSVSAQTTYVNRSSGDADDSLRPRGVSTLCIIEIEDVS